MHRFPDTPALRRLDWILCGLDGSPGWGGDADSVFAPDFTEHTSIERYVAFIRQCGEHFPPIKLTGLQARGSTARAWVQTRVGQRVVTCAVERDPPHRIVAESVQDVIPAGLSPRLPADFRGSEVLVGRSAGACLIVFSGLPGTGKSTLADATGRELRVPVFSVNWLLGALTPFGGYHLDGLVDIGAELAITLALRQLQLGQSAVVDHPAEEPAARARWESLADAAGAEFKVVVCTCSDLRVQRARLEHRVRGIPGWHERGNWDDVERRLAEFPPWTREVLTVDAVLPMAENLAAVLDYVTG